jgi:hypothetical protein
LNEDEVTDQVSSLKKAKSGPRSDDSHEDEGFGIEDGSFKWNEVEDEKTDDKDQTPVSPSSQRDEADTAVDDSLAESTDHKFELKDISVIFPEGQLSVITGPTASGKTALLVRPSDFFFFRFSSS